MKQNKFEDEKEEISYSPEVIDFIRDGEKGYRYFLELLFTKNDLIASEIDQYGGFEQIMSIKSEAKLRNLKYGFLAFNMASELKQPIADLIYSTFVMFKPKTDDDFWGIYQAFEKYIEEEEALSKAEEEEEAKALTDENPAKP